jgi:histidine triad (HIT) family protein
MGRVAVGFDAGCAVVNPYHSCVAADVDATLGEMAEQPEARDRQDALLDELRARGECYQCRQLTRGDVFPGQPVVWEDDRFISVLDMFPRATGHLILIYKPHREDLAAMTDAEAADLMQQVMRHIRALKASLGAEKVYVVTMCDGALNHLHVQLLPRLPGDPVGGKLLHGPRRVLVDDSLAARVASALGHD